MTGKKIQSSNDTMSGEVQINLEMRSLFAAMSDCILVVDDHGAVRKIVETNFQLQNISPLSFLGKTLDQFISNESGQVDAILKNINNALQKKAPVSFDYMIPQLGRKYWFHATISPLDNQSVIWIAQDITDRKEAEYRIKLLAQAVMTTTDCVSITDLNDTLLFVNKAFSATYGFSEDELIGKKITVVRSPLMNPEIGRQIATATREGGWNGEILNRHKDGTDFYLELWTSAVCDENGKPFALVGIARDLSEQKKNEAVLRRSESKYRMLFEYANDPIIIFRPHDEMILEVNKKACDVYGFTKEEFSRISLRSITKDPERGDSLIQTILREGKYENIASVHFGKNGKEIYVHSNGYIIEFDGQQAIVAINRDMTPRMLAESRLHENEERLRLISENVTDYIALLDSDGTYHFATDSYRLLGYDPTAILGTSILSYVHPEDSVRFTNELQIVIDTYSSRSFEFRFRRNDGGWINTEIIINAIVGAASSQLVIAMRDITERVARDEEIRRFSLAIKQSPVSIVITDAEGTIDYVNPKFCEITGYAPGMALGQNIRILKSEEMSDDEYTGLWKTILAGREWEGEFHTRKKSGELFWGNVHISPIKNARGAITHFLVIDEDITEKKKVEEALRNERILLRTVIDNLPDAIYAKDTECRKTLANLADVHNMDLQSESEVLGKDDFELFPKELAEGFFTDDKSVIQTGQPVLNREEYVLDENGQKRWLLTSKLPLRNQNGEIVGLIGIGRDISQYKLAEEQLLKSEEKMRIILENIFDGFSIYEESLIDKKRYLVDCNRRYAEMAGRTKEELLRISNTIPLQKPVNLDVKDRSTAQDIIGDISSGIPHEGNNYKGLFSWIRPDGKENYIESSAVPVTIEGKVLIIGLDRDVTERIRMEKTIRNK